MNEDKITYLFTLRRQLKMCLRLERNSRKELASVNRWVVFATTRLSLWTSIQNTMRQRAK